MCALSTTVAKARGFGHETAVLWVSTFVLLFAALAKLFAARQTVPLLLVSDPVFPFLTKRQLFDYAGILELFVVCILVWSRNNQIRLLAIALLSSGFIIYHIGLTAVGAPQSYCPCLGSVGGRFGITDKDLGTLSFIIATLLWCGSSFSLLFRYLRTNHAK